MCTESLNANDGSTSAYDSVGSRCKAHTYIKDIRGKVQFLLLSSDSRPVGPENQYNAYNVRYASVCNVNLKHKSCNLCGGTISGNRSRDQLISVASDSIIRIMQ